jgi:hypothetical protein
LCPEAFPVNPAELRAKQDLVAARYAELKKERDPIERSKRLREQMREDNEILRLNTWVVRTDRALKEHLELPFNLQNENTIAQLRAEAVRYRRELHDFKEKIKARVGLTAVVKIESQPREPEPAPKMHPIPGGGWTTTPPAQE